MMILTFFSSFFFFDLAVTVITLGCSLESNAVTLVCGREHLTVTANYPQPLPCLDALGKHLLELAFSSFGKHGLHAFVSHRHKERA